MRVNIMYDKKNEIGTISVGKSVLANIVAAAVKAFDGRLVLCTAKGKVSPIDLSLIHILCAVYTGVKKTYEIGGIFVRNHFIGIFNFGKIKEIFAVICTVHMVKFLFGCIYASGNFTDIVLIDENDARYSVRICVG